MSEYLLEMKNISKSFPSVKALDGVTLRIRAGSVHALMGENGAGKSTLMKCLFGINALDGGEILLDGSKVSFRGPKDALENGVAMVHQELNQALKRSVADNLWLGRYPKLLGFITREGEMRRKTEEIFSELEIKVDPAKIMSEMSVSERQMVEIAKALSINAKILIMDEPTSALDPQLTGEILKVIKNLAAEHMTMVIVTHEMNFAKNVADHIIFMENGVIVEEGAPETLFASP